MESYFDRSNAKQVVDDGFGAWFQYDAQIKNIENSPDVRWFIGDSVGEQKGQSQ